jgi:hypothetical protein
MGVRPVMGGRRLDYLVKAVGTTAGRHSQDGCVPFFKRLLGRNGHYYPPKGKIFRRILASVDPVVFQCTLRHWQGRCWTRRSMKPTPPSPSTAWRSAPAPPTLRRSNMPNLPAPGLRHSQRQRQTIRAKIRLQLAVWADFGLVLTWCNSVIGTRRRGVIATFAALSCPGLSPLHGATRPVHFSFPIPHP